MLLCIRLKFHRSPLRTNVDLAASWDVEEEEDLEVRGWFNGDR